MKLSKKLSALILAAAFTALPLMANAQQPAEDKPIVLKTMGSLFFGGTVQTLPNGETFHGDHGYAQFYIPQNARTYPLIMWHGIGQSGKTYESTPDGREGYMAILPRRLYVQQSRHRQCRTDCFNGKRRVGRLPQRLVAAPRKAVLLPGIAVFQNARRG